MFNTRAAGYVNHQGVDVGDAHVQRAFFPFHGLHKAVYGTAGARHYHDGAAGIERSQQACRQPELVVHRQGEEHHHVFFRLFEADGGVDAFRINSLVGKHHAVRFHRGAAGIGNDGGVFRLHICRNVSGGISIDYFLVGGISFVRPGVNRDNVFYGLEPVQFRKQRFQNGILDNAYPGGTVLEEDFQFIRYIPGIQRYRNRARFHNPEEYRYELRVAGLHHGYTVALFYAHFL